MTCETGKFCYRSRRAARKALGQIPEYGRMHPYRHRGHWHLGHGDRLTRAKRVPS